MADENPGHAVIAQGMDHASSAISSSAGHLSISDPNFTFWVNVALSSATIAVTCVGVVVAVSAIVGYQSAKRMIRRQAIKQARSQTDQYLKSEEFQRQLRSVADGLLKEHIKDRIVLSLSSLGTPTSSAPPEELREE